MTNEPAKKQVLRSVAEDKFIEDKFGKVFEGVGIKNLTAEQRETALTLAKRDNLVKAVDPSRMSPKERRDYNYRRNVIQQLTRNDQNTNILANAFRNSTLINETKVVEDMIASQGLSRAEVLKNNNDFMEKFYGTLLESKSDTGAYVYKDIRKSIREAYKNDTGKNLNNDAPEKERNEIYYKYLSDENFMNKLRNKDAGKVNEINKAVEEYASGASPTELKAGLTDDQIKAYLKSHDVIKEQVISNAASDMTIALDDKTKNERQLEAVRSSSALTAQTATRMMQDVFKKDEIDSRIREMLQNNSSRFFDKRFTQEMSGKTGADADAYASKFISQNYSKLLTQVSLDTFTEQTATGQTKMKEVVNLNNGTVVDVKKKTNEAMHELMKQSTTYTNTVNKKVTEVFDPAKKATEAEKANFFASSESSEDVLKLVEQYGTIEDALKAQRAQKRLATKEGRPVDGIVKTKRGIVKVVDGAWQGTVFGLTNHLPKQSDKYLQWNHLLERKISDVKAGQGAYKNFTRAERETEVKKLESQKILQELPSDFYTWDTEKQNEFNRQQLAYKREAFTTNVSRLQKTQVKVNAPKDPSSVRVAFHNIGYNLGLVSKPMEDKARMAKHKQDLANAEASITRYNSTKAVRNKKVDFGTNFENFANTYLTQNQYNSLNNQIINQFFSQVKGQQDKNGNVIKSLDQVKSFANLSADQQNMLIRTRESQFDKKLQRVQQVASKKVAKDNGVKSQSYTEKYGVAIEDDDHIKRYKNGASKYTHLKSKVRHTAMQYDEEYRRTGGNVTGKIQKRYNKLYGKRSPEEQVRNQNEYIRLQRINDQVQELNSTFRGTRDEYKAELQKRIGDSELVNKIYKQYKSMFKGAGMNAIDLESSPTAVQKNEVSNGIHEQMRKYERRLGSNGGAIPASKTHTVSHVGKSYSTSGKALKIEKNRQLANEWNSAMRTFAENRNTLSYEQLHSMLKPYMRTSFLTFKNSKALTDKKFNTLSDREKKDMLQAFMQRESTKANRRVNNDSFYGTDKSKLTRLNGTYVERSRVTRGTSPVMMNAIRTSGSTVYQSLVQNFNSTKRKVDLEQLNVDRLYKQLQELTSRSVQTSQSRRDAENIRNALASSRMRLNSYKRNYEDAEKRKKDFERAFAAKQSERVVRESVIKPFNRGDLDHMFDRYKFPLGPAGDGRFVRDGSMEARRVRQATDSFISKFKPQLRYMLERFSDKELADFKKALTKSVSGLDNDLKNNIVALRSTTNSLKREIKRLQAKDAEQYKNTITQLQNYDDKIEAVMQDYKQELARVGVDITRIEQIATNNQN